MPLSLDDLRVYPIKSCGGISMPRARVVARGLEHDRRFMLVDASGRFVTLRTEPRLPFVELAIRDDAYDVAFPGGGSLRLPQHPTEGASRTVTVSVVGPVPWIIVVGETDETTGSGARTSSACESVTFAAPPSAGWV